MHPCLCVDEILRLVACELVASEAKATAVSLACCRKCFEDPMLDTLWERQDQLIPLLKCFPQDVWSEGGGNFSFKRIPTKAEWTGFQKHARRMRNLKVDTSKDPAISQLLLSLQLHAAKKPFLSRLKTFAYQEATEACIPFIPLFLSPNTIGVDIRFAEGCSAMAVGSLISKLPILCPDLESIALNHLPRDPITTNAVSEMVLACNRNSLRVFQVDSPLTEAREVVYQLPRLIDLYTVIEGQSTSLPTVLLPALVALGVEYKDDHSWLQGFRGANLEKLAFVFIESRSDHVGDFLREFESVALTTSIPNTLSSFRFHTTRSWNPNYRSLLPFGQLGALVIEFSCDNGCSSHVDDDMITDLAREMPKLEILQLGGTPCETPGGVTVIGLTGLAHHCPHLSKLRIHFDATSLVGAVAIRTARTPSDDEAVVQRGDCALTDLDVGAIPVPPRSAPERALGVSKVASTLLRIFPHICNVKYTNSRWGLAAGIIKTPRPISGRSGGVHPPYLRLSSVTRCQETQSS